MKLSEAISNMGYSVEVDDEPWSRADVLGSPQKFSPAVICEGGVVAILSDSWDYSYSASHEIAELIHNFQHSEELFITQCNILATWHRLREGIA